MKLKILIVLVFIAVGINQSFGQKKPWANPVIKDYGQILDLEKVTVTPDLDMEYKILIEIVHDMKKPERLNFYANNVARLINLHAIGGVKKENLKVVVVIHASATNSVINAEAYEKKYKVESPYVKFYEALDEAGVEMIVCGQSLNMFGHQPEDVVPQIKIATSALTAISTYQLKGYAFFKMG